MRKSIKDNLVSTLKSLQEAGIDVDASRLERWLEAREKDPRPFGCKCQTLAHHLVGDGCDECNPELYKELMGDGEGD